MSQKIAYVVPTKDRPIDLQKMLNSITTQTIQPTQIIIVDGSTKPIVGILNGFPNLSLDYVRVIPAGLAKQRNAGMAKIQNDITVAGYLDDDLVLEPTATEKIISFWNETAPTTGGASFSIINQPYSSSKSFSSFFLLDHKQSGKMMSSSFQAQIPFVKTTVETDWLYGGATLWRREVIQKFSYDEWYIGTGYLEDVDYSYRVRQKYRLFVVSEARAYHYSRQIPLNKNYILGRHQIINRTYFFCKMKSFSRSAFVWALFGQFLHNVFSSIIRRNSAGLRRAAGNLTGLYQLMTCGIQQVPGHYK
jgi:GT2 family glycosyltransferase